MLIFKIKGKYSMYSFPGPAMASSILYYLRRSHYRIKRILVTKEVISRIELSSNKDIYEDNR